MSTRRRAYYGTIGKGLELPDKSSHAYRQREVINSKVKKTLSDEWSVESKVDTTEVTNGT